MMAISTWLPVDTGDGEADAFDRDGALGDDVGREGFGDFDGETPVGGGAFGVERDDREMRVPAASTWPWTTWPPRGEPEGVGSSRLTSAPG